MRRIVYAREADRLVYLDEKATPEFWDARWEAEGRAARSSHDEEIVRVTEKYLPRGSRVLEGGCGRANKVQALADAGFAATGIDFAEKSVRQARLVYPGLDIRQGDVRSLEFENETVDGYWSLGVIEHFWDGYDRILAEAARVLRPNGVLFLTAPWFSPYRRRKARGGGYPLLAAGDEPQDFYQFALSRKEVSAALTRHGFRLDRWSGIAPEISMREDMQRPESAIHWLLGSRGTLAKRGLRYAILRLMRPYCGHSFLAVARREQRLPAST